MNLTRRQLRRLIKIAINEARVPDAERQQNRKIKAPARFGKDSSFIESPPLKQFDDCAREIYFDPPIGDPKYEDGLVLLYEDDEDPDDAVYLKIIAKGPRETHIIDFQTYGSLLEPGESGYSDDRSIRIYGSQSAVGFVINWPATRTTDFSLVELIQDLGGYSEINKIKRYANKYPVARHFQGEIVHNNGVVETINPRGTVVGHPGVLPEAGGSGDTKLSTHIGTKLYPEDNPDSCLWRNCERLGDPSNDWSNTAGKPYFACPRPLS